VSKHRRRQRAVRHQSALTVVPAALLGLIGGAELAIHVTLSGHRIDSSLPVYGYAVLAFLAFKLGLAIWYRPPARLHPLLEVAAQAESPAPVADRRR